MSEVEVVTTLDLLLVGAMIQAFHRQGNAFLRSVWRFSSGRASRRSRARAQTSKILALSLATPESSFSPCLASTTRTSFSVPYKLLDEVTCHRLGLVREVSPLQLHRFLLSDLRGLVQLVRLANQNSCSLPNGFPTFRPFGLKQAISGSNTNRKYSF